MKPTTNHNQNWRIFADSFCMEITTYTDWTVKKQEELYLLLAN